MPTGAALSQQLEKFGCSHQENYVQLSSAERAELVYMHVLHARFGKLLCCATYVVFSSSTQNNQFLKLKFKCNQIFVIAKYRVIQKERIFERLVLGVGWSDCGEVWRV